MSSGSRPSILLVADSEYRRGAYHQAADIYLRVAKASVRHPRLWLRPLLGYVQASLKSGHVEHAVTMAWHALSVAEQKHAAFEQQVSNANAALRARGVVSVPMLPPRKSVVATRLGYLFYHEGEPEQAQAFFEKAIDFNPRGATRARQGLAHVCLSQGDSAKALRMARESILHGRFRAKTISSWPIFIAATRQRGGWSIGNWWQNGLRQAPPSVRARAILVMVRRLRERDMRQWRVIADQWLKEEGDAFPIEAADIRKMILASYRSQPTAHAQLAEHAQALLATPHLSPVEWLAGAKQLVRGNLLADGDIDLDALIQQGVAAYGKHFEARICHGLALACELAKQPDLARALFERNIDNTSVSSTRWGRSLWAYARMEWFLEEHAKAAELYRRYWESTEQPLRFRMQAQLRWVRSMLASGHPETLEEARPLISETLSQISDIDTRMDMARLIKVTTPNLSDWADEIFDQASRDAREQLASLNTPAALLDALFKLTRRQVYDFHRFEEALQQYEALGPAEQDRLWSENSRFWEYMGLLLKAHCVARGRTAADRFANGWLEDPATPPQGLVHVGVPYGRWLADSGRVPEALALFRRITAVHPSHSLTAHAWYWMALEAHTKGNIQDRNRFAANLRNAQGVDIGLLDEWRLDARALLLLEDLDVSRATAHPRLYRDSIIAEQKATIIRDMEWL